ncbi:MAG: hypothetical protein LWW81_12340 [Rhodocyclales bacterium]|nr:hypothetical protein [Rhodocyclales bacterium]
MSLSIAIKIVTTANHTHRFFQTDAKAVQHILTSLAQGGQHFFSRPSLILVNHSHTEIFNPRQICMIEFETLLPLEEWLPTDWRPHLRQLADDELAMPDCIDDGDLHTRVDLLFKGGHCLRAWLEGVHEQTPIDRKTHITQLFERPWLLYQPESPGIGFINPATIIHARIGLPLHDTPSDSWQANEA